MHDKHDVNTLFDIRPVNVSMKNMELGEVTCKIEDTEWVMQTNTTRNDQNQSMSSVSCTHNCTRNHRWTITDVQACTVMAETSISFTLPFLSNTTIRSSINKQMTLTKQIEESKSETYTWTFPSEKVLPYTE